MLLVAGAACPDEDLVTVLFGVVASLRVLCEVVLCTAVLREDLLSFTVAGVLRSVPVFTEVPLSLAVRDEDVSRSRLLYTVLFLADPSLLVLTLEYNASPALL